MSVIKEKEVGPYATLYRDSKSGLAWIEDGSTGFGHSCHPNIDIAGSVSGMKALGYWGKSDRIVRTHGFKYNIDRFSVSKGDKYDELVAEKCGCVACRERRNREKARLYFTDTCDLLRNYISSCRPQSFRETYKLFKRCKKDCEDLNLNIGDVSDILAYAEKENIN